tara:strand:- start:307 stop:495 length:189 start_codon:yes stop_codon:yes gene_type:complete
MNILNLQSTCLGITLWISTLSIASTTTTIEIQWDQANILGDNQKQLYLLENFTLNLTLNKKS